MATSSDQLSPPESPPVQFSECLVDVRSISRKGALREDDNEHEKPAQLLDEVPAERRVPVVWSGLNAHVPIFEARPSFGQRVKRSIPCWPSGSRSSARKQQVRPQRLWLRGAGDAPAPWPRGALRFFVQRTCVRTPAWRCVRWRTQPHGNCRLQLGSTRLCLRRMHHHMNTRA